MKLYTRQAHANARYLLLFGSGLIGSAIDWALRKQQLWSVESLQWQWNDPDQRAAVAAFLPTRITDAERVDIIWAAGVSGFGSSDSDMELETAQLAEVAQVAYALTGHCGQIVFHLLSSMGGLHEGQRGIGVHSAPAARRAYGRGKLAQEQLVMSLGHRIVPQIYRASSVYGYTRTGRRGLFAAMIAAMLQHRPINVYGSACTLRDYVYAPDIATFIANAVADPPVLAAPKFLASGKPTSVIEAVATLERLLERRLYCRYDSAPHNALDMTVQMSALPVGLPRTPLSIGVASVARDISRNLICLPHQTR